MNVFEYDFGYSWPISYGFAVPLAIGIVLAAVATWRRWRPWVTVLSGVIIVWSAAALYVTNVVWGINKPMTVPAERFLHSGSGRVLDAGAGSGRAAVGVLLARPQATVTALDIYNGYYGIDDNTPARFMKNARIAGAARGGARAEGARRVSAADRQHRLVDVAGVTADGAPFPAGPGALARAAGSGRLRGGRRGTPAGDAVLARAETIALDDNFQLPTPNSQSCPRGNVWELEVGSWEFAFTAGARRLPPRSRASAPRLWRPRGCCAIRSSPRGRRTRTAAATRRG